MKISSYTLIPSKSIFTEQPCFEYPTRELIYGFLHNKMGVKLDKSKQIHEDENMMYNEYLGNIDLLNNAFRTTYSLSAHGYGRVNPRRNLSLSKFHRPSRHTFCHDNYIDIDMCNAHPQLAEQIWTVMGGAPLPALAGYNLNYKLARNKYAEHYKVSVDAVKKLPLRLCYGGSVDAWRKESKVDETIPDLNSLKELEDDFNRIRNEIYINNELMIASVAHSQPEEFGSKTLYEKKSSIMALFFQDYERKIQESCASLLCENYGVDITRLVPCQDGLMILKSALGAIDPTKICDEFEARIQDTLGISVGWAIKEFDERRFDIVPSANPPISIPYSHLVAGGVQLATSIAPHIFDYLKFNDKCWFHCQSDGIWVIKGDNFPYSIVYDIIVSQLDSIRKDIKINKGWEDDKKKKDQVETINKLMMKYNQESTISGLAKILKDKVRDSEIWDKLDSNPGILAYKNGILDLRTNTFRGGILGSDYISKTIPHNYAIASVDVRNQLFREFLKICNNNQEHADYYFSTLGYMMTGESKKIQAFWTIKGERAGNGKSTPIDALALIAPCYFACLETDDLDKGVQNRHKAIAAWKGARILYLNETEQDAIKDGAFIKKLAEGNSIPYKVMYGIQKNMTLMAKLLIVSNHPLNFTKKDKGLERRNRIEQLDSSFKNDPNWVDDFETNTFRADPDFPNKLTTIYKDAFLNIIAEYAKDFYDRGGQTLKKFPAEWEKETKEDNETSNLELDWFNKMFIFDEDGLFGPDLFKRLYNKEFYPDQKKPSDKAWKSFLKREKIYKMNHNKKAEFEPKKGCLAGFRKRRQGIDPEYGDEEEEEVVE